MSGKWDSKDPLMVAYRREVDVIAGHFKGYQVEHIDRRKNEAADALADWDLNVSRCHLMSFLIFCITLLSRCLLRKN